jgi:hypothetical protein
MDKAIPRSEVEQRKHSPFVILNEVKNLSSILNAGESYAQGKEGEILRFASARVLGASAQDDKIDYVFFRLAGFFYVEEVKSKQAALQNCSG